MSWEQVLRSRFLGYCVMELPAEGSIERGRVSRLEPYGAFVDIQRYRCRGLVHISNIVNYKVHAVEDALSLNDMVWVKVLEITREDKDGRANVKIRLSMKDAAQDGSGEDLGQQKAAGEFMTGQSALSLNSTIGMGVALDPMVSGRCSNLVLKSDGSKHSMLINGYALVGDDEGEESPIRTAPIIQGMGRGRGSTLPAWMTRSSGPSGATESDDDRKIRKQKKRETKEQRKDERKRLREEHRHSRKHRKHSSDTDYEDRQRRKRRRRVYECSSQGDSVSASDNDLNRERQRCASDSGKRMGGGGGGREK